jgi:Holliday junction resolvase RusA-like endonuclease
MILHFSTNEVPITGNQYLRTHWLGRSRQVLRWRQLLAHHGMNHAHGRRARVHVVVFRKRRQDEDNLHTSLKPLFDALTQNGLLVDDSLKWTDRKVEEVLSSGLGTTVKVEYLG